MSEENHRDRLACGLAQDFLSTGTVFLRDRKFQCVGGVLDEITDSPTGSPTDSPTNSPTASPSVGPTLTPTKAPTSKPSASPIAVPTSALTFAPTSSPSLNPSTSPTRQPTRQPTQVPTIQPSVTNQSDTGSPTVTITEAPSSDPSNSTNTEPPAGLPGRPPTVGNVEEDRSIFALVASILGAIMLTATVVAAIFGRARRRRDTDAVPNPNNRRGRMFFEPVSANFSRPSLSNLFFGSKATKAEQRSGYKGNNPRLWYSSSGPRSTHGSYDSTDSFTYIGEEPLAVPPMPVVGPKERNLRYPSAVQDTDTDTSRSDFAGSSNHENDNRAPNIPRYSSSDLSNISW
mmetsp:Transcript_13714/g.17887  ORF Transcript_13714/g.17887 Transcript_13714/m.17887 type:complete len:345 (+) Transcript_13714:909-1943(+)